jgi:hypothetical protein
MKRNTDLPPPPPGRGAGLFFLDRNGRWFHEGIEITHERTLKLFFRSLSRGADGTYCIRVGRESAVVDVEDTPFLVAAVTVLDGHGSSSPAYRILLNDGTEEDLDPTTLSIEKDNIMYCGVKKGEARARFLRAAYYQLCAHIEYEEEADRYVLPWKGDPVRICTPETPSASGN